MSLGLGLGLRLARGSGGAISLLRPGVLSSLMTFSRSQTSATAAALVGGGAAWWTEYAANAPRYVGAAGRLLLEGARTTISTRGRLAGGTGWTPTNLTAATTTGPDGGGATANRLNEGVATGVHQTALVNAAHTSGLYYAQSVIAKAGTGSTIQLYFGSSAFGTTAFQNFDLGSGVLGTSGAGAVNPRIVSLGDGWYWCSVAALASASTSVPPVTIAMTANASAARAGAYTGTGRTVDVFWGQVEAAAPFASSQILAASEPAAVTRGQDNATAAYSALFPAGRGTILASLMLPVNALGTDQTLFEINNGSASNRIRLRNVAGGASIVAGRVIADASTDAASLGNMTAGTLMRVGLTFDGSSIVANLNGGTNQSVAGMPGSLTTLRLGNDAAGAAPMFGEAERLDVLPYVIPAASLPAAVAAFA